MEIIAEGRRAVPSRPYPCGILTVTVRCTNCGYTKTVSKQVWRKSRKICPVCSRPKIGTIRDGWELIAYPEGGKLCTFRCTCCGRTTRKRIGLWSRPCVCRSEIADEAMKAAHQSGYSRGRKLNRNSASGVRGVCWNARRGVWRAYIMIDGRQIGLGEYDRKEDAVTARKAGEIKYFGERQEKIGLTDEYAEEMPEGFIPLTAWAESHGRTKKAAQYHARRGRIEIIRIGQTDYILEGTPWPTEK